MSEKTTQNQNSQGKKARLGRGLGSLLGGDSGLSDASPSRPQSEPNRQAAPAVPVAQQQPSVVAVSVGSESKIDELSQIWKVPIDRLQPNTQQPRQYFAPDALKDLTASIKEKGILQPIVARRKDERTFEIIAGERRWRAAQLAGLHDVPVILKKVDEQDSLELAIIENIQRQDLNAIEEAEAYDKLMQDYRLTQQQVADKVGKERATVANALRLLVLPRELKEMVKKAELSAGHAKAILAIDDSAEQVRIGKRVATERLSVRAAEQLVAQVKRSSGAVNSNKGGSAATPAGGGLSQRLAAGLAAELQKLIGTKVTIDYADSKGKLAIYFYSDDELNDLTDKIRNAWVK